MVMVMEYDKKDMIETVAHVNDSGDQIVFVKVRIVVVLMVFVKTKIYVPVLQVLKLLIVVKQLLLIAVEFV